MLRRIRMVLPLFFAFVLTLLPFLLLEFTQFQRNEVQKDRDLYLWEQEANNYLQLFSTLWSYELQIKRRMSVFRKTQGLRMAASANPEEEFPRGMAKRFPKAWLPKTVYAGKLTGELDSPKAKFKLFKGSFYGKTRRRVFERILKNLVNDEGLSTKELRDLDRFTENVIGNNVGFKLLKQFRRGRLCNINFNKEECLLFWDYIQSGPERIGYICIFPADKISSEASIKMVYKIMEKNFPEVLSAIVPLEEADKNLQPVFDQRLSDKQISMIRDLARTGRSKKNRSEILPIGSIMPVEGQYVLRNFVDFKLPYELWLLKAAKAVSPSRGDVFIFLFRLGFLSLWLMVFAKVLITGRPIGVSIENYLTLIFIVIGVVPLVVLYIAGSLHLESSQFRQEQQAVKKVIRQFEEADVSGEAILSEYREFCRNLEMSPAWRKAMIKWNPAAWKKEVEKMDNLFPRWGLRLGSVYIYPPPISKQSKFVHSFNESFSERDAILSNFYKKWVDKAYYTLLPELTFNEDCELPFFEGVEGREILRLFMGNRADTDIVEIGDDKQFFYQNYVMENGKPRNWYFFRADIEDSFEHYLKTKVIDWHDSQKEIAFCLAKIVYPDPEIIFPDLKKSGNFMRMVKIHAKKFIDLAASTKARIFKQTKDRMIIVYPCRKAGKFILSAVVTFRSLHQSIDKQEFLLGLILVLLCVPVFFTSRFISGYLVKPLKQVEHGLRKAAEEDFTSRIHLNREDELGALSDAFDHMVDGIIERRNLGRFVSAGLDNKIAQDNFSTANKLERSYGVVLCSDIRSFTELSEKHSVRDIVVMLNQHLTEMSACVTRHGGLVEQFIGDAILAIFFGETEQIAVQNAINAGIGMVRSHRKLVKQRLAANEFPYEIGVGIEAGMLISGALKVGAKNEYVLVGLSRSQSEKLEGRSKLGKSSRIICSEKVKNLATGVRFVRLSDNENWEIDLQESLS